MSRTPYSYSATSSSQPLVYKSNINNPSNWEYIGSIGPFDIQPDQEEEEDDKDGGVSKYYVVNCTTEDVYNIRGYDVIRYEPNELR